MKIATQNVFFTTFSNFFELTIDTGQSMLESYDGKDIITLLMWLQDNG